MWFAQVVGGDRTKATLSCHIKTHILPGHIMSDMWPSYVSADGHHNIENNPFLAGMDYSHEWVNDSPNFVDSQTGARTQRIEGDYKVRLIYRLKQYFEATPRSLSQGTLTNVSGGYGISHHAQQQSRHLRD
ncbi:hypothetical protein DVH05_006268 [Phytophthora capsici]|nr:hypothetical protein DVH05_006268 [Phytophthora capsici]